MMENRVTWNNALTISCPEGFHVLDEAERGKLNFIQDGPGGDISDPERHILISVGWKPFGGLSAMLLGIKDVAKNTEGRVRKPMQKYGYRLDGMVDILMDPGRNFLCKMLQLQEMRMRSRTSPSIPCPDEEAG